MNRFTKFSNSLIARANLSKKVADHLVGEDHTPGHRKMIGVGIMAFGVMVAKGSAHFNFLIIHILGDGIGYFFHAVGAIPFLKGFESAKELLQIKKEETENGTPSE